MASIYRSLRGPFQLLFVLIAVPMVFETLAGSAALDPVKPQPATTDLNSPAALATANAAAPPPSESPPGLERVRRLLAGSGRPEMAAALRARTPATTESLSPTVGIVFFVYFIEADQTPHPNAVARIEQQAIALQHYWHQQFGGTFRLNDPVVTVIEGAHPAHWYDMTPNGTNMRWYRLNNMRDEVRRILDVAPNETIRMVTYPAAQIDGRVGANRYGGAWMDGDDVSCIEANSPTVPYSSEYPAHCLATVIHELGHVYGLDHQGPDTDCMQLGFYSYTLPGQLCTFSNDNVAQIQADPNNTGWLLPPEATTP